MADNEDGVARKPEVVHPKNDQWSGIRNVSREECEAIIGRYYTGDRMVTALRWGVASDRFTLSGMLEGRALKVHVLVENDEQRFIVLGAEEV